MKRNALLGIAAVMLAASAIMVGVASRGGERSSKCVGLCWAEGRARSFTLEVSSHLVSEQMPPQEQIGLRGKLEIQMLSSAPRLVRLIFSGTVSGIPAGMDATLVNAAFHTPITFELGALGQPVGLRGAKETRGHAAQVWTSLLWAMQHSQSPDAHVQWTAQESDGLGTFDALYRRKNASVVEKRRVRYTGSHLKGVQFSIDESAIESVTDKTGNLTRFSLREQVRSLKSGPLPGFAGRYTYLLNEAGESDASGWRDAQLSAFAGPTLPPPRADRADEPESMDDARIAGRRMPDVMARLIAAEAQAGAGTRSNDIATGREYVALAALLRREAEAIAMAREHIEKGGPLAMTLIEALRDAGTPAAQSLLVELLANAKITPQQRLEIARSLGRVERPTEESIAALKGMRSEPGFGQQARYGMGSAVFRLKEVDPQLALTTLQDLVSELQQTRDDGTRVMALVALGNAGHPGSVAAIAPFFTGNSEPVRAAAAQALRRVVGPEADALLVSAAKDPSITVRFSVANAISERAPSDVLTPTLRALSIGEPDFKTRAEAIRTASSWLAGGDQVLRASLQQVATSDPSMDLRAIAQQALARVGSGG